MMDYDEIELDERLRACVAPDLHALCNQAADVIVGLRRKMGAAARAIVAQHGRMDDLRTELEELRNELGEMRDRLLEEHEGNPGRVDARIWESQCSKAECERDALRVQNEALRSIIARCHEALGENAASDDESMPEGIVLWGKAWKESDAECDRLREELAEALASLAKAKEAK